MIELPHLIERYFELAGDPGRRDEYVALFAPDAVVTDEGRTHRGRDEIRRWRDGTPQVTYDVTDIATDDGAAVVTATITGDFPGSPFPGLRFRFQRFDDEAVRELIIAP